MARVGGPAGDDHLRASGQGPFAHHVHVDAEGLGVQAVGRDRVVLPGEVDLHAVGEVPAVGELQAHDGLARGDEGVEDRGVGLGPGVRLDVRVVGAEEGLGSFDGEGLDFVDLFAAPVVSAARIAFGVLVGQHRPLGLQDGPGHEVLRGDHLQGVPLPGELGLDGSGDLGVDGRDGLVERWVGHWSSSDWVLFKATGWAEPPNGSDRRTSGPEAAGSLGEAQPSPASSSSFNVLTSKRL